MADSIRTPFTGGLLGGGSRTSGPTTKRIGTTGTAVVGGYIVSTEKNDIAVGINRYLETSNILANISIVAAGVRYFVNLVSKAGWVYEPAAGENINPDDATRFAELTEEIFSDMEQPWHRVVRRSAGYRLHGFSIQEWTAKKRDDGVIGFLDIEARPQQTIERWDVDSGGTVFGVIQSHIDTGAAIYLPRTKIVYMVDDALSDSPEGLGLARHLFEPAQRLRRFQLLEAYGFEGDLRGIPIARAPIASMDQTEPPMTEEQKTAALAPLNLFIETHIKNPELGMLLDSSVYRTEGEAGAPSSSKMWDIELLQGNGNGAEPVAKTIERLNREMARILGVEGLLLGGDKVGSLALSQDKSQNFALIVDSTLAEIAETYERDLLVTLFRLNGWPEEMMPTLKTDQTQYRDITQITQSLVDLASAGAPMAADDPAQNTVRDLVGLPIIDLDEALARAEEAERASQKAAADLLEQRRIASEASDGDDPPERDGEDPSAGENVDDLEDDDT